MNDCCNALTMKKASNYVTKSQIIKNNWKPFLNKNIIFAKVGAAVYLERKRKAVGPFLLDNNMMVFQPNNANIDYIYYTFQRLQLSKHVQVGTLPSLNASELENITIFIPSLAEQKVVADFGATIDHAITLHEKKKRQLERLKSALLQKMLADKSGYPDVRFKGFNEAWTNRKLGNYFDYEQPTPYIVTNTNYSDEYNTPVLTAGQSFILGYTDEDTGVKCATYKEPVIIFDDFTTSTHLVTFPFKVKSSAMKILTLTQKNDSMYFGYTSLQNIKYKPLNHERQWISIFSKIKIGIPISKIEERKIGNLFERIDRLDNYFQQKIERLNSIKQSLLQRMFI